MQGEHSRTRRRIGTSILGSADRSSATASGSTCRREPSGRTRLFRECFTTRTPATRTPSRSITT
jgi:hypothetical protein